MSRRALLALLALLAVLTGGVAVLLLQPSPPPVEGDLALETVLDDLALPVSLAFAPDGRWFYNELQEGRVRVVEDGRVHPDPFLSLEVVTSGERGLLGLALHPDFATEPYVYVYYSFNAENGSFNRISRFRDQGNVAGPEEPILDWIPAANIHNSGRLAFGPDGKLYASVGDVTQQDEAQDPGTLPGSILRLNPDGTRPGDNPFPDSSAYLIGIRNVFGLEFTPGGTLLFTENGPLGNDEVNRGLRGGNYGWPLVEGAAGNDRFETPLWSSGSVRVAPTGVAFYTGDRLGTNRANAAYFGSWNDGILRRLQGDAERGEAPLEASAVLATDDRILDVVDGPDGSLYLALTGRIARVVVQEGEASTVSSLPQGGTARVEATRGVAERPDAGDSLRPLWRGVARWEAVAGWVPLSSP